MCSRVKTLGQRALGALAKELSRRACPRDGARMPSHTDWKACGEAGSEARPGEYLDVFPGETGTAPSVSPVRLKWGFRVDWQKGLVYNARIESLLARSAMWDRALERGPCVVAVASFYEPHRSELFSDARSGRRVKRPYEFTMPDGRPMLLAGVCEGNEVAIVTTEPNEAVAPVHDRMPLVLLPEELLAWIGGNGGALADRSGLRLHVEPEALAGDGQQALF